MAALNPAVHSAVDGCRPEVQKMQRENSKHVEYDMLYIRGCIRCDCISLRAVCALERELSEFNGGEVTANMKTTIDFMIAMAKMFKSTSCEASLL